MDLRKIIREQLEKVVFNEDARRLESLNEHVAAFINPINQGYDIYLYDPNASHIYGVITFTHRGGDYQVAGVAAQSGFGPFMYELAMMHIAPEKKGLMPARDGDVRGDAWNVWEKFYERSDVQKKTLDLYDDSFRFDIISGDEWNIDNNEKKEYWDEITDEDKKTLKIFNTAYGLLRNQTYKTLVDRASEWKNKGFDDQEAQDAGENLWISSYNT